MQLNKNHGEGLMTTLSTSDGMLSWFAVYTATNHEKRVAQHLQVKEIETFLPLYSVTKRWKNRTTAKVELPLFAGYIFVRIAPTERIRVLEVPMVYSIVGNRREPSPLPQAQIEGLRAALRGGQVHPFPYVKVRTTIPSRPAKAPDRTRTRLPAGERRRGRNLGVLHAGAIVVRSRRHAA